MDNYSYKNYDKKNNYRYNQYDNSGSQNRMYAEAGQEQQGYDENTINAESLNIDTTLNEISKELRPGETLILDIGNNYFHQTDEIYDTLVMRGYEVRKSFKNGRNQILVHCNT